MNNFPHQTLHQQLVELRGQAKAWLEGEEPKGFRPERGICDNLPSEPRKYALLRDLMAAWPGGTGDRTYPVPHPIYDPEYAFYSCDAQETWNPMFDYARNRLALLDWLIKQTALASSTAPSTSL